MEVAKLLIKNGADVDAKDKDDWTALRWAFLNRHSEMISLLKSVGAKE